MHWRNRRKRRQSASSFRERRLQLENLEARIVLAAQPMITEFLASNDNTLLDGNGESSDWIEIFNAGDATIDLENWYLTDDAGDLTQWQFPDLPESVLDPGEYLVVFASGDGVPDPAGNLHTNFALSADGEYVGLVMPDGTTVASSFGENGADYPEQFTDVSYGFEGAPLADEAPIQYFDADEAPGGNTSGLFGGWVPRGAGAGDGGTNFANEGGALQADGAGDVAELATTVTGLDPNEVYEVYAFFWDATSADQWHLQAGLASGQLTQYDPGSPDVFAIDPTTQVAGSATLVSGLNVLGQGSDTYDDYVDGNRILYAARVGEVSGSSATTLYIDRDPTIPARSWYDGVGLRPTGKLVDAVSAADYLIPTDASLAASWTANGFDAAANGFTSGNAAIGYENDEFDNNDSYKPEFTNPELPSGTTSVYLRTQFNLGDASAITSLTLNMKYDDGFVAYLNGVPVVSQFAPENPTWNSVALPTGRSDAESLSYESFVLSAFTNLLIDGQNTLAIHALNRPSSSDFLMSPQLLASTGSSTFSDVRYLTTPTPGTINGLGVLGFVEDTKFSVDRGFFDAPFNVDITSATADADIYYSLDGSEPSPTGPTSLLFTSPILIDETTYLRAAAFKTGFEPTDIDTQTYVFVEDVVQQDPLNVHGNGPNPDNGLVYPTSLQQGFTPQFDMDPEIVNAAEYDDGNGAASFDIGIRQSLLALPSIALTLPHDQFFGPLGSSVVGIATDATQRVERSGSIEFFDPNTGQAFQFNAEIEAHGNSSRNNSSTPKHSFRVTFNRTGGGPSKLTIPIFENSENDDINVVVLRGIFTEAFAARNRNNITNRFNPLYSTYIRDTFLRDTQIETGNLSPASTYAHLYINGLYWGLYNPTERIDDKFLESNLGGNDEDYDIVRGFNGELFRGERTAYNELLATVNTIGSLTSTDEQQANLLYQQLQGNFADGTNDPNREALLDVDSLIDYLIIQQWSGAGDWPGGNWYAARNRVEPGKGFQFIIWDQELSLDQLFRDRTGTISGNDTPGELYNNLRDLPEFQLRYADRAHALLANNGPLSPAASQARWDKWANLVEPGIVAESARWGDAQEGIIGDVAFSQSGPPGTIPLIPVGQRATVEDPLTIQDWRTNVAHVRNEVLAKSADILLGRLLSRQLFTSVDPPDFAINGAPQHGGSISAGSSLTITAPGTIYYTIDGSDPRSISGAPAGVLYTGSIPLDVTTVVKARTFSGGEWSALSEATFTTDDRALAISEINYNPYGPTTPAELAISGVDNDDFEFIEFVNTSPTALNLNGFQLVDGVTFTFGNVTLAPGQRALVVENLQAFEARYGTGLNVLGQWSGGLSNDGETVELINGLGAQIVSLTYNDADPWAITADGSGATLVLDDPSGTAAERLGKSYSWRGSAELGGTPGAGSAPLAGVVINEVLAHTEVPIVDEIELHNPTDGPIDISGWFLSDSDDNFLKYPIPSGTILGPGEYIVFNENQFGFGLKSDVTEQVYLVMQATGGAITFVDQVEFGASFDGQTLGRSPIGDGRFAPLISNTLGSANSLPQVGPLVISEVNYHPVDPVQAALAIDPTLIDNDLEFIEIHNPTATTFDLSNWELNGEGDFAFPTGTTLSPGGVLVVVSFDPSNVTRRDAFRAHYGIGPEVTLVGGFSGSLNNGAGRVELEQPDTPSPATPAVFPLVTADELLYDDLAPWSPAADGAGLSLERVGPTMYGNDAASWIGATPSPGVVDFTPTLLGDYDRNGVVERDDLLVWRASFGSTLAVNADGNADGIVDAIDYAIWRENLGATQPALVASAGSAPASPAEAPLLISLEEQELSSSDDSGGSLTYLSGSPDAAALMRMQDRQSYTPTSKSHSVETQSQALLLLLLEETSLQSELDNSGASSVSAPTLSNPDEPRSEEVLANDLGIELLYGSF